MHARERIFKMLGNHICAGRNNRLMQQKIADDSERVVAFCREILTRIQCN